MFKVWVLADDSGKYATNALKFDTVLEAIEWARDLYHRWMLVQDWSVVPLEEAEHGFLTQEELNGIEVARMDRNFGDTT